MKTAKELRDLSEQISNRRDLYTDEKRKGIRKFIEPEYDFALLENLELINQNLKQLIVIAQSNNKGW